MRVAKTDWAAVYRDTYPELVRFRFRKVWDEERAQDLAQDAFARVLDHSPENPRALLFTVAANLARDEARMAVRRKRHLTLIRIENDAVTRDPDPIERLESESRRAAARQALERLSERDREVLLLWDAGMSYLEIADQTGLAVGAIGTTLARARQRLIAAHEAGEARHVAH
jgi:RNA polymerase sigma factor (sigma-70 family)